MNDSSPFRKTLSILASIVLVWMSLSNVDPTPKLLAPQTTPSLTDIEAFRLVSPEAGWLLADQHLYWTYSRGQSWEAITPPNPGGLSIQAVYFLDAQSGWVIRAGAGSDGQPQYLLQQTVDGGHTWLSNLLELFATGEAAAQASGIYLQFIDAQTGWLVVRQATSSNFCLGTLFRTHDGGQTWLRLAIPIGEPVSFATHDVGWTAGGAAGNELYRTLDGGQTWQAVTPASLRAQQWFYQLPTFKDAQTGVLPIVTTDGAQAQIEFHVTSDGGQTWQRVGQAPLGRATLSSADIPLAVFDTQQWVMIAPQGQRLVRMSERGETSTALQLTTPGVISALDMVTPESGWAKQDFSQCTPASSAPQASRNCVQEIRLLRTENGGQNWTSLPSPVTGAANDVAVNRFTIQTIPGQSPGGRSPESGWIPMKSQTGQGLDSCTIPDPVKLQAWITSSPYTAVNLYIGGSARACPNLALNAALIQQLQQQGWTFIPTWVGPQAYCSNFKSRMSSDPATAYNQGVSEADAAVNTAASLGLTLLNKSGTVIYYNLEAYITPSTPYPCRQVAQAFISGWSGEMRAKGNRAGVYGGACGSAMSDFASIPNVPDVVWIGAWQTPAQYRPDVSVFDTPCVNDNLWNSHQRLLQYAGDHKEVWGDASLTIDSNAIDSLVATGNDTTPPVATTQILLPYNNSPFRDFQVILSGTDNLSGVASYDLQYRDGTSGAWLDAITNTTNLTYSFVGQEGHTYTFHVRARDNAGNVSTYQGESQHTIPRACSLAPDIYEPDNTQAAARPLLLNATQVHNFDVAGDVDWVTYTAQVGQTYLISTTNTGGFADTSIELYAPDGTTLLAHNNDSPTNLPAFPLMWVAPTSGTYYLKVRHFDSFAYGCTTAYNLTIRQARLTFLPFTLGP